MTDATLLEIMDALADQIRDTLAGTASPVIDELQVSPRLVITPSASAEIDIYPRDPFQTQTAFRQTSRELFFTVRARVSTADHVAGQDLLLLMMDTRAPESVEQAIVGDRDLGGKVAWVAMAADDPVSGFTVYADAAGDTNWLGCEWRARIVL